MTYYGLLKKQAKDFALSIKQKDKWMLWELEFTDTLDKIHLDNIGSSNQLEMEKYNSEITTTKSASMIMEKTKSMEF